MMIWIIIFDFDAGLESNTYSQQKNKLRILIFSRAIQYTLSYSLQDAGQQQMTLQLPISHADHEE